MNIDDDIVEIMNKFDESKWLNEAKKKYTESDGYSDDFLISLFEVHSGGDIVKIND